MKLISLYIENFGGLSGYSLDFSGGVTLVQEPNGFGKTTLAEFIRAMFYGFPRKGKFLEKDRRQKYTPWNGAKAGGNLVFEHEGVRYRLERTFGAEPRGDTFKLIDLTTGKKSDRFSREIGIELFKLDADSFERSTYLPQLQEQTGLTTAGIQAKLSDLVEDPGDVGNFDKAAAALKNKRSSFIPYRGSGGTVAEARAEISRIQQELDRTEGQKETLAQYAAEIGNLERSLEHSSVGIAEVREQITRASEAAARAAVRKQHEDLTARCENLTAEQKALREKYPCGLPASEEVEAIRAQADEKAVLMAQTVTTQADLDAEKFLNENRRRFENSIPSAEALEENRRRQEEYTALVTRAQHASFPDGDRKQYETLRPIFESGGLDEEKLDALTAQSRQLFKQRTALEGFAFEGAEQLAELERYFAPGVPGEEEIRLHHQGLARSEALRQENLQLAAAQPVAAAPVKVNPVPLILALVLAAAGITLGVVLLIMGEHLFGGIALGAGVLALIAAIFLGMQLMVSRELSGAVRGIPAETKDKMEENDAKAGALEQAAAAFVRKYSRESSLTAAMSEIRSNREDLLELRKKRRILDEKRSALEAEVARLDTGLQQKLKPYFGTVTDCDKCISHLRMAREKFLDLEAKKRASEIETEQLNRQAAAVQAELTAFLTPYFDGVCPERFGQLLSDLGRDAEGYARAAAQTKQWLTRKLQWEQALGACEGKIAAFFRRYGLEQTGDVRDQLQQLQNDRRRQQELTLREVQLSRQLESFRAEHAERLAAPAEEQIPDLNELKLQERQLNDAITALMGKLLQRQQESKELQQRVDRLPELRDALEQWQQKQNGDRQKAEILDETMNFLQKAKDSLSTSYLGPIREHFAGYLQRLMGKKEQVLVNPDLEVQLERHGQARELAYFSAGQTDLVMLCMRLALVDALFPDEKIFVVLDDPFVNLDDQRTAEALELLKELAEERQILYLTCNSSRSL